MGCMAFISVIHTLVSFNTIKLFFNYYLTEVHTVFVCLIVFVCLFDLGS